MSKIYSSRKVGQLLAADPSSVNRWIDSGKLKAYRTPGGHRRVVHEDLLVFLEECGIPVPAELQPPLRTLLLVDDDEAYLRTLRKQLSRAEPGLTVQSCAAGYDALMIIGSDHPNVVVLAAGMPGLDGVEVCRRIKANPQTADVQVILTSVHPSPTIERKAQEAGALAMLVKPFKATAVLDLLRPPPAR